MDLSRFIARLSLFDFAAIATGNRGLLAGALVFFLGVLGFPSAYGGDSDHQLKTLAFSSRWLRLVHYKKSTFRGVTSYKSYTDDSLLFFSPRGKFDPVEEIQATWKAMKEKNRKVGPLELHPQCAFPARFHFLREGLRGWDETEEVSCPQLAEWKEGLGATGVTLVFSSSYANNPASLFGHTFLRIKKKEKAYDLLDYAVSFSADVDENIIKWGRGIHYALLGLLGFYPGRFSLSPYYMKVNEYNNSESRDLWEYDLELSGGQVEVLVEHLWELMFHASFDYYFLDENCSFHLLGLLEVAREDWNLKSQLPIFTSPKETTRILKSVAGVEDVSFRPSLWKTLEGGFETLNTGEKREFFQILRGRKKADRHTDPAILSQLIAYLNFAKHDQAERFSEESSSLMRELLILQASLEPGKRLPRPPSQDNRPDLGHQPSSIGLTTGNTGNSFFTGLRIRGGFHDLLNSALGYEPYQEINLLEGEVRHYPREKRFSFPYFKILNLKSLHPWHLLDPQISWGLSLEFLPFTHFAGNPRPPHDHYLNPKASVGLSKELRRVGGRKILFYTLLGLEAPLSSHFPFSHRFLLGPSLELSVLAHPLEKFKIHLSYQGFRPLFPSPKGTRISDWFKDSLHLFQSYSWEEQRDLRLGISYFIRKEDNFSEVSLGVNQYF